MARSPDFAVIVRLQNLQERAVTMPEQRCRNLCSLAAALTLALALAGVLALAGCDDDSATGDAPYLEITGGGFVFNYRVADAYYGFVARPLRRLPAGGRLEASFEDPAGGAAHVEQQPVGENVLRYSFRSPPLRGIKADRPYEVELRLIAADGSVLQTAHKSFTSQLDQDVNPEQPLTVGPGYQKNPAADATGN